MSKAKESKKGKAGVLFTAAMIGCCLLLYFAGGKEKADELVTIEAEETAPQEEAAKPQRAYPVAEVFLERAKEYGFAAELEETAGFAPSIGYTLKRGELSDGELVLSLKNGGVCAFTLTVPVPKDAGKLPDDPTPIELSLYEQRIAAAELEEAWLSGNFGALLSAIDLIEELTYADKTSMYSLILKTREDGKDRDIKAGSMAFSVSLLEETGGKRVAVSVAVNED